MKKVIFVAGAPFSGTTMLDLILGNDPNGFSCGEVADYLRPIKPYHATQTCGCGDASCTTWLDVKSTNRDNPHTVIFEKFPEVNFVVDSSKHPQWIAEHSRKLVLAGFDVQHVLIWKTPIEIAQSFSKRSREQDWPHTWVNYHRLYFSVCDSFVPIAYADLVEDARKLSKLCDLIGIPYFSGKEQYWEKKHCVLGGNQTARVHLYDKDSSSFQRSDAIRKGDTGEDVSHRQVKRSSNVDTDLKERVAGQIANKPMIRDIEKLLNSCATSEGIGYVQAPKNLRMEKGPALLRNAKRSSRVLLGKIRFS